MFLGENLREEDKTEITEQTGRTDYVQALFTAYRSSSESYVNANGTPGVIFGILPHDQHSMIIWASGTEDIVKRKLEFCKTTKWVLNKWFETYPVDYFFNFTHSKNTVHHDWLRFMGADLGPPLPYGVNRELFLPFMIKRK